MRPGAPPRAAPRSTSGPRRRGGDLDRALRVPGSREGFEALYMVLAPLAEWGESGKERVSELGQ